MATIEISCPVMRAYNPAWSEWWVTADPATRRQALAALVERGMIGAADADPDSLVTPDLFYPPWHACTARGGNGDGGAIVGALNDQGEAERAAADAAARAAGNVPGVGLGLVNASVPSWLKWLAWAAVIGGVAYLVAKRRAA